MIVELFQILLFSAVLFMVIENFDPTNPNYPYDFGTSFYYIVTTMTTVGYGDIYPIHWQGRIFILFVIVYTIVFLIPIHTSELLRLMGLKSFYARREYKAKDDLPHLVITGQVVIQALKNFSTELFHTDHGNQDRHAIILQPCDPSNEMGVFLNDPVYETCIQYINGNPIRRHSQQRADVKASKMCILLTNKNSKDAIGMDHKNILIGLALKKYVFEENGHYNMPLCMQLIKPESKQHFYSSISVPSTADQIIIVEEIKMNLMSKSCFSPGIINFISNLISTIGDQGEMDDQWLKEYAEGMDHEIYRIKLSQKMENRTFSEISGLVYKKIKGIVFAIEIITNGKTIIRLNPSDFIVNNIHENQIHVYTICPGMKIAEEIETLDMNKEEIIKYLNLKAQNDKKKKEVDEDNESDMDDNDIFEAAEKKNLAMQMQMGLMDSLGGENVDDPIIADMEDKNLAQDYNVQENSAGSIMSVNLASLENDPNVKNHIVVCGIHSAIKSFIMPLRAKYLKNYQMQKIVIITGEPDEKGGDQNDSQIWNSISMFKDVYLVNGSPLKQDTLLNANINYADKVVILGHDSTLNQEISDEMLDAESIYIYQAVKRINKNVQILTELVYSNNIEFLLPYSRPNMDQQDYHLSTLYAAGEVYISAIIDTLTCQSYFNPHIVTILQQILKGASEEDDEQLRDMMKAHPDLQQSNIWQIQVPESCVGKSFENLFMTLLQQKLICMALYRLKGATDNEYPYVYTNPDYKTLISHRDRAFVLGIEIPDDLQGDLYEMVEKDQSVDLKGEERKQEKLDMISKMKEGGGHKKPNTSSSQNPESEKKSEERQGSNETSAKTTKSGSLVGVGTEDQEDMYLGLKSTKHQSSHFQQITQKLEKSINQIEGAVTKISQNIAKQHSHIMKTTKDITREYLNSYSEDFKDRLNKEKGFGV